jgi:hypothetical protein
MAIELDWQEGQPKTEGLYLNAIKLGEDGGYYAFSYWNGNEWSQTYPEKVIAFYPANELVSKIDLVWPEPADSDKNDELPPAGAPGDYIEVF